MSDKTANINFRGTEKYREMLQRAAIDRGTKVQGLIERALEAYLGRSHAEAPVSDEEWTPEERRYTTALVSLLRSSDVRAPLARTMLDAWMKDPAAQTPPPKSTGGKAKQHEKKAS
jgi:hypothetical protein